MQLQNNAPKKFCKFLFSKNMLKKNEIFLTFDPNIGLIRSTGVKETLCNTYYTVGCPIHCSNVLSNKFSRVNHKILPFYAACFGKLFYSASDSCHCHYWYGFMERHTILENFHICFYHFLWLGMEPYVQESFGKKTKDLS